MSPTSYHCYYPAITFSIDRQVNAEAYIPNGILLLPFFLTFSLGRNLRIPVYRMVNALSSRLQLTDESKATAKSNDLLRVMTRSQYVSELWEFHKYAEER